MTETAAEKAVKLQQFFRERLAWIEAEISAACQRAGRSRTDVILVGVTKYVGPEVAAALHQAGLTDLAESRPQELWHKAALLPDSVRWHQIGHLQTNKVDKTLPWVALIHAVDSWRLLQAIEKEAARQQRTVDVLLEVNLSRESAKHGFAAEEMERIVTDLAGWRQVRVRGLMTMAALNDDPEASRPIFAELRQLRERLQGQLEPPHTLEHLSMGMSGDFPVAIEEGATLIRVGSILFEGLAEGEP